VKLELDPSRPYQPLEIGNGRVAASVAPDGRLLSISTYDREHGIVVLTSVPAFSDAARYDPTAVRAHRARLASPDRPGFGLDLDLRAGPWRVALLGDAVPESTYEAPGLRITVTTWAPPHQAGIAQTWRITTARPLRWRRVAPRLGRADYTQLTEGGPLPPAGPVARRWYLAGVDSEAGEFQPGDHELVLRVGFDPMHELPPLVVPALAGATIASRRGLAYGRIVALRTEPGVTCILADHEILPLSWNRDAYFVASLLRERGDLETVREHLEWLFRVAERPAGLWGRAHLANGRVKDRAFQLDQQCYPLLEAIESGAGATYRDPIGDVVRSIEARRQGELYPTDETPADDPLGLPFHFSSHVLLWRTYDALARAGIPAPDAESLRRSTLRAFTDAGRFAYATDGHGSFRHYHDANDVPTAFAPAWGFCAAEDARWVATIRFAWSEANAGGFYPGPFGGLGSIHTPHPWPLGDLQAIVVARANGDAAAERAPRLKLDRIETWNHMIPEAYDEMSGVVRSRHWFAWPLALRAILDG
jgi:hypothetical protein